MREQGKDLLKASQLPKSSTVCLVLPTRCRRKDQVDSFSVWSGRKRVWIPKHKMQVNLSLYVVRAWNEKTLLIILPLRRNWLTVLNVLWYLPSVVLGERSQRIAHWPSEKWEGPFDLFLRGGNGDAWVEFQKGE